MLYAFTNDQKEILKFPISPVELRVMYPDVSFPPEPWDRVDLTHLNIFNVEPTKTSDMPALADGMMHKLIGAHWNEDGTKLVRDYTQIPVPPADAE